jgi:serine/threonine protein kinase
MSAKPDTLPSTEDRHSISALDLDLGRTEQKLADQKLADQKFTLPQPTSQHTQLAATLQKMDDQWRAGNPRPAEAWFEELPQLKANAEDAVRIVYEEFCLREEAGEQPDSAEFYRRFPQWHEELAVVLQCHDMLRNDADPPAFPLPGETLGELKLIGELGRGALGRVFLATQPSLSDRPLAVKLTACSGQEHLQLARLQHTNIVPLYLVQDFPPKNLRAICMPYLGGATWSAVLNGVHALPLEQLSGEQIVKQLTRTDGGPAKQNPRESAILSTAGTPPRSISVEKHAAEFAKSSLATAPAIGFLARSSYIDAVCWIGACLADALSYAHQRGLVHLDIKPSNVLVSADGQPMLLDFHIACQIEHLQENTIVRLGGTPGYMSPEQRAAAEAIRRGDPINKRVDARSDIYSLGVLLYESLARRMPSGDLPQMRRQLRSANPLVSRGLEDLVCKCLAAAPSARYSDAGQLAADLRCHLASLPLRGVKNRSWLERWQKWRRRKPYALPVVSIAAAALLVVAVVCGLFYSDRVRTAQTALAQSQQDFADRKFSPAVENAQSAWEALRWIPFHGELKSQLKRQLVATQRGQAEFALHQLVNELRFVDDEALTDQPLLKLAAGCDQLWQSRELLMQRPGDESTADRSAQWNEQLKRDLLDLAILSARLDVRAAPPETIAAARQAAHDRLEEARRMLGANPWLALAERDEAPNGNVSENALPAENSATPQPTLPTATSAWEHYALGRWLAHHGSIAAAAAEFSAAIEIAPGDFWARFQLARCQFKLGQFDEALASATVCVALEPNRAECFYNRALCYQALNENQKAAADVERALALDPSFAPAIALRSELKGTSR